MYIKKKKPVQECDWLSLSHLLENIGFSTLEDTIAEIYVLAPRLYILCEVDLCFVLIFWQVFVSAKRTLFSLQFKTLKNFQVSLKSRNLLVLSVGVLQILELPFDFYVNVLASFNYMGQEVFLRFTTPKYKYFFNSLNSNENLEKYSILVFIVYMQQLPLWNCTDVMEMNLTFFKCFV